MGGWQMLVIIEGEEGGGELLHKGYVADLAASVSQGLQQ